MAAWQLGLRLVLSVVLCGAFLPVAAADEPPAADSDAGLLTLAGTVVMPDGSPAAGATVATYEGSGFPPRAVRTDDTGRFTLRSMFGIGARLHAASQNRSHQTTLSVPAAATRTAFASPIELKLTPASRHDVTVTSGGKPIADARVSLSSAQFQVDGVTGSDGKARLQIPTGEELTQLVAWHPRLGVDSRIFDDQTEMDISRLSLRAPGSHTIHVVDAHGKPAAEVELGVSVRTDSSDWIVCRAIEAAHVRTGADGMAEVPWVPAESLKYVNVDTVGSHWKVDQVDQDRIAEGLTTVHARRERAVEGRLVMPAGASAEGILITGFGFGPGNHGDVPYARARRDGTFKLHVPADHGYVLGITDFKWASNPWSGILLRSDGEKPDKVAIDVYPATPVTVRVNRGADRQPVADAWVHVSNSSSVEFLDASGGKHTGTSGVRNWLLTDSKGVATTGVGIGEIKFRLASGKWGEERTIEVTSKEPLDVEFHRPWLGDRQVSGRLTLDGEAYRSSSALVVRAWAERSPYRPLRFEPEVKADGTLRVQFDADNLSLLLVDRENKRSGFARLDAEQSNVEIAMQPTATYGGKLIDENSKPMVDRTVRLQVAKTDYEVVASQQTDQSGKFQFSAVAGNVPLQLRVDNEVGGPQYHIFSGDRLFLPGEERLDDPVKPRRTDSARKAAGSSMPLAKGVASICRSARLSRMHGLVALHGDDSRDVTKVVGTILDHNEFGVVVHYVTLAVGADQLKTEAKALDDYGWPLPAAGEVVLVALDGDQKTVASGRIETENRAAALKSAAEFLKQHKPPARDAVALAAAARKEAQASGRRVWVVYGGPRCGPCFRLALWMDDQHATLEKDFVLVKVMGGLDQNAAEAINELPRKDHGIPFHAITEADGTVLVTSEGPLGNIGMPSSVEGIRHLRRMLEETVQTLTPDEVDGLIQSLSPKR